MKTCLKTNPPKLLEKYYANNPNATWEQFKGDCKIGYKHVQRRLRIDQGNLCCYCEIDLKCGHGIGKDDFRVEHFHPKANKKEVTNYNWALDWQNMLGCCHGGTEKYVTESGNRFIPKQAKNQRHSDALKGEFIWDDEILNPLKIPPFPLLFQINDSDGSLSVIENNCMQANIDVEKAKNSLHEGKLNLNSTWLKIRRKTLIDKIADEIANYLDNGFGFEELAKIYLSKDELGNYPAFFTSIRSYFDKDAENYLTKINYQG
jgi:uncharacterized protein (TIGR02646 family)